MISAVHTLVYADDAARAFFRDVLGWPHVDVGGGWLIFKTGPSELGVHPTSDNSGGQTWSTHQHHEISLICDDAEFTREIRDEGSGLTTILKIPGAGEMMLYQPKHTLAHDL